MFAVVSTFVPPKLPAAEAAAPRDFIDR
ncbi:hypothetical protein GGD63_000519 [Bradyrhizobium sp. cir1]|nr:hypothetical protein [Bradyrhizobium sp. cir1]